MKKQIQFTTMETAVVLFEALRVEIKQLKGFRIDEEKAPTLDNPSFRLKIKAPSAKIFSVCFDDNLNPQIIQIFVYNKPEDNWTQVHSQSASLENFQTLVSDVVLELEDVEKILH